MISAALWSMVAWLAFGLAGVPVDPFLPLVAAVALQGDEAVPTRLGIALALGPLTAVACADLPLERTVLYGTMTLIAVGAGSVLRDTVVVRTALVAGTLGVVVGVRALLALGGAAPAPPEGIPVLVAAVAWTAAHASLCKLPSLRREAPA